MNEKFHGFESPEENWSKLPHQFINLLPAFKSLAEMKVVLYVIRHTWGYREIGERAPKWISTSELINGTGDTRQTVYKALSSAVQRGIVVKLVDNTDRGRVEHHYRLRTRSDTDEIVYSIGQNSERNAPAPWHDIDPEVKRSVYARSQGRCSYCNRESIEWHYDHILPRAQGGDNSEKNLCLACPKCNLSKNNRTPHQWGHLCYFYDGEVRKEYELWQLK